MKRFIIIAGVLVTLGGLAFGGQYFLKLRRASNGPLLEPPAQPEDVLTGADNAGRPTPPRLTGVDQDGDLLPDDEERRYGTDPSKADTDGDGLNDWVERAHWRTDPLKADTDGDGYSDGQEVASGYDPRSKDPVALE